MASSEQLEREAQAARAQVEATLAELRRRVSPGRTLGQWVNRTIAMASKTERKPRRTARKAEAAAERPSSSAANGARGLTKFMTGEPMLIAGLGIALGAIIGALLPATEMENRAMGEASDRLKRDAREEWERGVSGDDASLVPSNEEKTKAKVRSNS